MAHPPANAGGSDLLRLSLSSEAHVGEAAEQLAPVGLALLLLRVAQLLEGGQLALGVLRPLQADVDARELVVRLRRLRVEADDALELGGGLRPAPGPHARGRARHM